MGTILKKTLNIFLTKKFKKIKINKLVLKIEFLLRKNEKMKKCYEKDLEYFSYKKANVLQNYSKIKFILEIEFVIKNKKKVEKCYRKDLEYFSYKKVIYI